MGLENEEPEPNLEEMAEAILEMTHELACDMIQEIIGYRPVTGNNVWTMGRKLRELREKSGPDWVLVKNVLGWFHIVRPKDAELLKAANYQMVSSQDKL